MQSWIVDAAMPQLDDPTVLAIGKFDGVHRGHQAILQAAQRTEPSIPLSVLSFFPHPRAVLLNDVEYAKLLTPGLEKERILGNYGVERLFQVRFTREYASTSAESFVFEQLSPLNLRGIVVGSDFRFGRGGKAGVEALRDMCGKINIPVIMVPPVEQDGEKVSSSRIREHIRTGNMEAAAALLGRPYTLTGVVVHGNAMGRQIGFPTANLADIDDYVLPGGGVYAVLVEVLGENPPLTRLGVLNAGFRPTFEGTSFRLEAHLLDFDGDLYGKQLRVSFVTKVRDEQKFPQIEALMAQIAKDVEFVRGMNG